jgi:DNA-binding transcriptional ArsR family regulator
MKDTAHYADLFAALGSEPRLEIMRLLFAAYPNGLTVGEIQAQLKIPNSTLSHHLEKLRVEGLVNSKRDKQYLWYSANAETVEELLSFLYNGCAIGDRTAQLEENNPPFIPEAEQIIEPSQPASKEGFMFEEFLRSIGYFLLSGGMFNKCYLPRGFERFTQKAIQSISLAQNESQRLEHAFVGTEQMILGLLDEGTGIAAQVLTTAGVNANDVRREVEKIIGRGRGTPLELPFTPRAKKALELAVEQSHQLSHSYVGTEHLLLGILIEGQGLGVRVLENLGFNAKNLEQQLQAAMNS